MSAWMQLLVGMSFGSLLVTLAWRFTRSKWADMTVAQMFRRKPKAPERPKAIIRLWDKEWNLIHTHTGSGPMYATIDIAGQRRLSGRIELVQADEHLDKMLVWPNPFIPEIDPGPPIPMSEFYLGRRYGPNGWVDQDADLPQAGSAWNWSIKIGDTDYE